LSAKRLIGAQGKYRKAARGLKVFLLLFLQKKKILFFSEEKNQKTFTFWRRVRGSGIWPAQYAGSLVCSPPLCLSVGRFGWRDVKR
jgi:hypothetical protein